MIKNGGRAAWWLVRIEGSAELLQTPYGCAKTLARLGKMRSEAKAVVQRAKHGSRMALFGGQEQRRRGSKTLCYAAFWRRWGDQADRACK